MPLAAAETANSRGLVSASSFHTASCSSSNLRGALKLGDVECERAPVIQRDRFGESLTAAILGSPQDHLYRVAYAERRSGQPFSRQDVGRLRLDDPVPGIDRGDAVEMNVDVWVLPVDLRDPARDRLSGLRVVGAPDVVVRGGARREQGNNQSDENRCGSGQHT